MACSCQVSIGNGGVPALYISYTTASSLSSRTTTISGFTPPPFAFPLPFTLLLPFGGTSDAKWAAVGRA